MARDGFLAGLEVAVVPMTAPPVAVTRPGAVSPPVAVMRPADVSPPAPMIAESDVILIVFCPV